MGDFIEVWIFRAITRRLPRTESLLAPILRRYRSGISRTPLGRPVLHDPGLDVSVSHSHKIWMAAFGRGRRLGLDLERKRGDYEFAAIARDHFTKREREFLFAAQNPADVFFNVWTQKEAVLKALGHGLQVRLDTVEVEPDPLALPRLVSLNGGPAPDWHLKALNVDPDYKTVLAIEGPDATINFKFYEKSLVLETAPL